MDKAAAQRALMALGYNLGKGGPSGKGDDGIWGKNSIAACAAFQRRRGLAANGDLTVETIKALQAATAEKTEPRTVPAAPVVKPAVWPLQKDVAKFFGEMGKNQVKLPLPFDMRIAWDKGTVIRSMSLHEKIAPAAGRVFARIADAYPDAGTRARLGFDLFGGSLNVRKMRGGSAWSMHSWGIAIDFDPERNQLKWGRDRASLAKPECERFWQLWEEEGFVSLGRAQNRDWMHVQAARI
jgi:hypothetical protein